MVLEALDRRRRQIDVALVGLVEAREEMGGQARYIADTLSEGRQANRDYVQPIE